MESTLLCNNNYRLNMPTAFHNARQQSWGRPQENSIFTLMIKSKQTPPILKPKLKLRLDQGGTKHRLRDSNDIFGSSIPKPISAKSDAHQNAINKTSKFKQRSLILLRKQQKLKIPQQHLLKLMLCLVRKLISLHCKH